MEPGKPVAIIESNRILIGRIAEDGVFSNARGKKKMLAESHLRFDLPLSPGLSKNELKKLLTRAHLEKKNIDPEKLRQAAEESGEKDPLLFLKKINGTQAVAHKNDLLLLLLALGASELYFDSFWPLKPKSRDLANKLKASAEKKQESQRQLSRLARLIREHKRGELSLDGLIKTPEFVARKAHLKYFILYGDPLKSDDEIKWLLSKIQVKKISPLALIRDLLLDSETISETELLEARFGIAEDFSSDVKKEIHKVKQDLDGYLDIRRLGFFSIDDPETRDFDDAIAFLVNEDGTMTFHVAVTDIAGAILPGSAIDREAFSRASSCYMPDRVIPMLPEELSFDRLALMADSERGALVLSVKVQPDGEITGRQISLARIQVMVNMTYDQADDWIVKGQRLAENPTANELALKADELSAERILAYSFYKMSKLIKIWQKKRLDAGAVILQRNDLKIEEKDGEVSLKVLRSDSQSRQLIAEAMILYNNKLAEYCLERKIPLLYRSQQLLDNVKGQWLDANDKHRIFEAISGMHKAELTVRPAPHEGLGLDLYCQCTSPIRRYSDLVLQRQMRCSLMQEDLPFSVEEALLSLALEVEERAGLCARAEQYKKNQKIQAYFKAHKEETFKAILLKQRPFDAIAELQYFPIQFRISNTKDLKAGEVFEVCIRTADPLRNKLLFERK